MSKKKENKLIHATTEIKMIAFRMEIAKYVKFFTNVLYLQQKNSNSVFIWEGLIRTESNDYVIMDNPSKTEA